MFKSLIEADARSCDCKAVSHGGNPRMHWWTAVVSDAINLKKEVLHQLEKEGCHDSNERLMRALKAFEQEFGVVTERDFLMAPKMFWHTSPVIIVQF